MEENFMTFDRFKDVKNLNEDDSVESTIELEGEAELDSQDKIPAKVVNKEEESSEESPIGLPTGGLIKPKTLPEEVIGLLNERIGDEYKAYFFYRNAANWCKDANYNKAAEFFNGEAANELEHSKGLQDYLTQWNTVPTIPTPEVSQNFTSLIDIINKAYQIEYTLFMKYSNDVTGMLQLHPGTFNFLQKYVDYQTDEVAEYADLLNALELVDINNKLDVLFFEKNYF